MCKVNFDRGKEIYAWGNFPGEVEFELNFGKAKMRRKIILYVSEKKWLEQRLRSYRKQDRKDGKGSRKTTLRGTLRTSYWVISMPD